MRTCTVLMCRPICQRCHLCAVHGLPRGAWRNWQQGPMLPSHGLSICPCICLLLPSASAHAHCMLPYSQHLPLQLQWCEVCAILSPRHLWFTPLTEVLFSGCIFKPCMRSMRLCTHKPGLYMLFPHKPCSLVPVPCKKAHPCAVLQMLTNVCTDAHVCPSCLSDPCVLASMHPLMFVTSPLPGIGTIEMSVDCCY